MALVATAIFLIGCATDPTGESTDAQIPHGYPTIAAPEFQGTFEITEATAGGTPLELGPGSTRQVEFDVVTGAATVDLGCDRRLGSFTLAADGQASITLTGRIEVDPCPPSDVDDVLVDLIARVGRWEPSADGFRLIAAGGDNLIVAKN